MPYAEIALATKNPIPLLNNTQTHLGLTSLLSVPGSAFGLHFTRHGVPFLNEVASYEYVLKSFTREEADKPGVLFNKLNRLKDELLDINSPSDVNVGQPISNLSYTGGPGSVYGIGSTTVKRATDTLEGWKRFRPKSVPPPAEIKDVPTDNLPIEEIGSVSAQFSARQAQTVIDANTAAAKTNAENARLADQYKKLDTEFSPKYSISKHYAPELNNNETLQGNIPESKTEGKRLGTLNADWADPNVKIERSIGEKLLSLETNNIKWNPGTNPNPDRPSKNLNTPRPFAEPNSISGNNYASLPYAVIRRIAKGRNAKTTTINDFRSDLTNSPGAQKTFSTNADVENYTENNLSKKYGFGDHGNPNNDRSNPYGRKNSTGTIVGNIDSVVEQLKAGRDQFSLSEDSSFRGDKINAIDYISEKKSVKSDDIYSTNTKDFIKFYFSGIDLFGEEKDDVIVFRATVKGIADSFSPSWSTVSIMGRPDGPAIYSSFERNVSFNFTVAATSREELVPMWRKLNYLTSYTMPIYGAGRPGGALCRMTIGDMFYNTPGYFTGMTVSVNDEASWDLADDIVSRAPKNKSAKQLPNLVDVDVQFKIIHDWRPQKGGRSYHLYEGNYTQTTAPGSWLWDSNI